MSSIFCFIFFHFEDQIVMSEQMSFYNSGMTTSSGSTIPVIDNSQPTTENVGVGMYPSLMRYFNIFAPILTIGSILGRKSSSSSSVPFHTMYVDDPWTLSSLRTSDKDPRPNNMEMSLSIVNISDQATLDLILDPSPSSYRGV